MDVEVGIMIWRKTTRGSYLKIIPDNRGEVIKMAASVMNRLFALVSIV